MVVTEQCLLHESRNPGLGREGIENMLKEYLGLEKVIWLWKGIAGDDAITNGHVDNFCCFVHPGKVLLAWSDDEFDVQVRLAVKQVVAHSDVGWLLVLLCSHIGIVWKLWADRHAQHYLHRAVKRAPNCTMSSCNTLIQSKVQ